MTALKAFSKAFVEALAMSALFAVAFLLFGSWAGFQASGLSGELGFWTLLFLLYVAIRGAFLITSQGENR